MRDYKEPEKEFSESVVEINRISKKTKGGNQIRFSALVVLGDKKGRVGLGNAKATDVRNAIRKAIEDAKKRMIKITMKGTTVSHSVRVKSGASEVLIKPAPAGSGIIAGGPMRIVLESAGLRDVVGKSLGSNSKMGNIKATIEALEMITFLSEKKSFQKNGLKSEKEAK